MRQMLGYLDSAIGFIYTHFFSLTPFVGMPNNIPTESQAFVKSINSCSGPTFRKKWWKYKTWRTTINNFMQPPINSSLFDPNIQLLEHNPFCHTKIQFFTAKEKRNVALQNTW